MLQNGVGMDLTEYQYAGVDRRISAYFIDMILLYLVIGGIQYGLFLLTDGFPFRRFSTGVQIELWVLLTVSFPTWLYFALGDRSAWRGTLGKRLLRLQVSDYGGGRIGFGRALLRTVLKLLPWEILQLTILLPTPWIWDPDPRPRLGLILVYILVALYLVPMFLTLRRQSIHDFIVGTLVLERVRNG